MAVVTLSTVNTFANNILEENVPAHVKGSKQFH